MNGAATLPALFREQAKRRPTMPATREKKLGIWRTQSWSDAFATMKDQAFGLAALGFEPGDRLCVIGDNRPRLYGVQIAAQALGGVAVPLDANRSAEELAAQVNHAHARWLVLEAPEQLHRMKPLLSRMTALCHVLVDSGEESGQLNGARIHGRSEVDARGRELARSEPDRIDRAIERLSSEDAAVLSYTSNAASPEKGELLSHRTLIAAANAFANTERVESTDEWLAYMPLGWSADSLFSLTLALVRGFPHSCPESPETTLVDLAELSPHGFFAPRQTWEALRQAVERRAASSAPLKRCVFDHFLAAALAAQHVRESGQPLTLPAKARLALGELLVYRPVRVKLGLGRCRWAYVEANVLDAETVRFFRAIGIDTKSLDGSAELAALAALCGSPSLSTARIVGSERVVETEES